MAYLSKSDAINKLTNGFLDNDSFALYYSDNNHNLSTIYYTNSAKTTLLPAGNYCLPTNYRTLYITVGSNGKLTQLPELLFATEPDSTFVDDTIFSQVSNSRERGWGEDCSMNGFLLTDTKATTPNPFQSNKQWVLNSSNYSTSAISNLDLSDMRGYDLMFYVGGYGSYNNFNDPFASTFFVHVQQNLYKPTIITDGIHTKIYFFRQDYWFTKQSINQSTFFKRNLFLTPLKNKRGGNKYWSIMDRYAHDVIQYDKTTVRTSTKKNRGLNYEVYTYTTASLDTGQIGHGYVTTSWQFNRETGIYFDQPYTFLTAFQTVWGYAFNRVSDLHQVQLTAMFRSMFLGDFTGIYSAYVNGTTYNVNYADANPYQWRCTFNSGNASGVQPCNAFVDALKGSSTGTEPFKVAWWFWDFEDYYVLGFDEIGMKGVFESFKNAKAYVVANNLSNIDTKITPYAAGVYSNGAFRDQYGNLPNSSNYTNFDCYYDYHNYYINGTITKDQLKFAYNKAYYSYIEYFSHSFISNYINNYNPSDYFYRLLHYYDITNKIISERLGANHQIPIAGFIFNMFETLPGATMQGMRKAIRSDGTVSQAKPDIPPDFWQGLAAWGFGYADGVFNWNSGDFFLEYYQDLDFPQYIPGTSIPFPPEKFKNDFAGIDWFYSTLAQLYQNRDIIENSNSWQYSSQKKPDNTFTSGTENYPFTSYAFQRPLIVHKFSSNGLEALVMAINPFNNGYTKSTATIDLYGGYPFTIDMWGTYTTIMRVKVSSIPPSP